MTISIGYAGKLSKGGTPTTLTAEACSAIADDAAGRHRYQITNTAKHVLDPATAIVVLENGVASSAVHIFQVDAQAAIVTFATGYTPGTPVTITGKYIPRAAFAFCKEMESIPEVNTADVTQLNQAGYDQAVPTTFKWSGSFSLIDLLSNQGLDVIITGRTPILIDFDPVGAGTSVTRGWALLSKSSGKVSPKDPNQSDVSFTLWDQSVLATALSGFPVNAAFSMFVT